jgi:hypothetical protein
MVNTARNNVVAEKTASYAPTAVLYKGRGSHHLATKHEARSIVSSRNIIGRGSAITSFKMARRQHITVLMVIAVSAFLGIFFVSIFRGQAEGTRHPDYLPSYTEQVPGHVDAGLLHGEATAPKLENATLK